MKTLFALFALVLPGCTNTYVDMGSGDWVYCSSNPDPVCNDHNPCTFDICNEAYPCNDETCEGSDPGPTICWHLPLDEDSDGYATREGICADLGYPWVDCNDHDSQVRPGWPDICDDGIDNNCDGQTDMADDDCSGG